MNRNAECEEWSSDPVRALHADVSTPHSALRTPNSTGFTLIEVLLSLAILALISTVIYMSFSSSGEHVEQAEAARDEVDLARTLIARMSDDIANAFCKPGMKSAVFFGKQEEVETPDGQRRLDSIYLSTLTNWRRLGSKESDLWVVGYLFREKPDGSGYQMVRYERRDLSAGTPPLEDGVEYVLTDRIRSLRLRYFYGSNWKDELGSSSTCLLPKAVEIALTTTDGKLFTTITDVRNEL